MQGARAASDGTVYGLAGAWETWTQAAGWVELPTALQTAGGQQITNLSVGSASQVLAETSAPSDIYILEAGAWSLLSANTPCSIAEIGPDGSIWCIDSSQNIWQWQSGAWVQMPGTAQSIAVASAMGVWIVTPSGLLADWNGTGWTTVATPGLTFNSGTGIIAHLLTAVGVNFLGAIDSSRGIHVSLNAGGTWSTIAGSAVFITGGGAFTFVGTPGGYEPLYVGKVGTTIYHLNLVVPTVTVTAWGSWNCGPQGCPQNSYHTILGQASIGNNVTSTDVGGAPTDYIATSPAVAIGAQCDLIVNPDDFTNCNNGYSGWANCSMMGRLQTVVGESLALKWGGIASTGAIWNGGWAPGISSVICYTNNYCTATTTPPLCAAENVQIYNVKTGSVCKTDGVWLEELPFITVPGVGTVCLPGPNNQAIPLGPGASPVPCTTANSP